MSEDQTIAQDKTLLNHKSLMGELLQGNYRIDKMIGKGGMAWVYKAEHIKLQEHMAVKVLLPHISEDEEMRYRFLEEARIQFKLKHPNIVQVTDVIEDNGIFGIVMEWIEGDNLKQMLKKLEYPASRKDIWRVMSPVLDAVGHAHEKGFVHRDIKPANILLHKQGTKMTPKVADFGIAKVLDEGGGGHTVDGVAMGTLKFMSPEQIKDSKRVDQRADIYSLGVTMYVMATRRHPFEGKQEWVIYQQLHEDPPPPSSFNPQITPAMDALILKAMAKEPQDRFQNCAELAHALPLSLLDPEATRDATILNSADVYRLLMELPEERSMYDSSVAVPLPQSQIAHLVAGAVPTTDPGFIPVTKGGSGTLPRATGKSGGDTTKRNAKGGAVTEEPEKKMSMGAIMGITVVGVLLLGFFVIAAIRIMVPKQTGKKVVTPTCKDGETRDCYRKGGQAGNRATIGKGACKLGKMVCSGGKFGPCANAIIPTKEVCNGKDDDCDGQVDESFPEKGKTCLTKVGDCGVKGSYTCDSDAKKAVCKRGKIDFTAKPPEGLTRIWLKVKPWSRKFTLRYGSKKTKVKGSFCMEIKKNTRLRITGGGYYRCSFVLSKKYSGILPLRMKRRSLFDPPLRYCKGRLKKNK